MRHDPPLTFWPMRGGVLAATRGGITYRVEPMGRRWLCVVARTANRGTLMRNEAATSAAAVTWLTATARELEHRRDLGRSARHG